MCADVQLLRRGSHRETCRLWWWWWQFPSSHKSHFLLSTFCLCVMVLPSVGNATWVSLGNTWTLRRAATCFFGCLETDGCWRGMWGGRWAVGVLYSWLEFESFFLKPSVWFSWQCSVNCWDSVIFKLVLFPWCWITWYEALLWLAAKQLWETLRGDQSGLLSHAEDPWIQFNQHLFKWGSKTNMTWFLTTHRIKLGTIQSL